MAATTGISWTDATANPIVGCTQVGPGCEGCYAAVFAINKFNIKFGPGERRHVTQSGFADPPKWQRMHDRGQTRMRVNHQDVPVPRWVFFCSLSDFFDNEWPDGVRDRAWAMIRECPALRPQIVTKRIGNVAKMLPTDWGDGSAYRHVGIISTMVNQDEVDRDMSKLLALKEVAGVRWIGLSIEPQLGPISLQHTGAFQSIYSSTVGIDWCIVGGESTQGEHKARPFDLSWPRALMSECKAANVPIFVKQLGDHPMQFGGTTHKFGQAGADPSKWPGDLRVQQMPRVFDDDPPYQPRNLPLEKTIPLIPVASNDPELF